MILLRVGLYQLFVLAVHFACKNLILNISLCKNFKFNRSLVYFRNKSVCFRNKNGAASHCLSGEQELRIGTTSLCVG